MTNYVRIVKEDLIKDEIHTIRNTLRVVRACQGLRGLLERETYLDSTFRKADFHGYLLPEEDVRIVGPIETPFELVQLGRCEPRSVPFLLGRLVIALPDRCRVPCNDDLFLDKQRQLIIN